MIDDVVGDSAVVEDAAPDVMIPAGPYIARFNIPATGVAPNSYGMPWPSDLAVDVDALAIVIARRRGVRIVVIVRIVVEVMIVEIEGIVAVLFRPASMGLGNAQQVGDDGHRQRIGKLRDEIEPAVRRHLAPRRRGR